MDGVEKLIKSSLQHTIMNQLMKFQQKSILTLTCLEEFSIVYSSIDKKLKMLSIIDI